MDTLVHIVVIGVVATAFLDLVSVGRKLVFATPPADYGLVGRWIGHMPRGVFRHESIAGAAPVRGELWIGWIAHYLIGIAFAAALVAIAGQEWAHHPTLAPALIVGACTVAAPFLLMQPGMGAGIAASRTPKPGAARARSLVTHALFGVGLYAGGWVSACAPALASDAAGLLLVVNKSAHDVGVLDLATGKTLATIPTGHGPHEVAVSPDGSLALVTNYGERSKPGSSLTVIDVARRAAIRTIDLGKHRRPHGVAFFADGRRAAITTEDSRHLLVVDAGSGRIERAVETAQDVSHMVALAPDARHAYVANIGSGSLTVIDLEAGKVVKQVATGDGAEGVAVTPDGREIWVSNRAANTVSVVDAKSLDVVATLPSPGYPIRAVLTPDGRHALVSNARSAELAVFDVKARKELKRLKLLEDDKGMVSQLFGAGSFPVGIAVSADGRRAFVAITGGDRIAVVDTKTWTVTGYWEAGDEPDGMAVVGGR